MCLHLYAPAPPLSGATSSAHPFLREGRSTSRSLRSGFRPSLVGGDAWPLGHSPGHSSGWTRERPCLQELIGKPWEPEGVWSPLALPPGNVSCGGRENGSNSVGLCPVSSAVNHPGKPSKCLCPFRFKLHYI